MAIQKTLSALAILIAITFAAAAVAEQSPKSVSLNPAASGTVDVSVLGLPSSQLIPRASTGIKALTGSQDYGICIDPTGVGKIFGFGISDHLHPAQSYGICIDPEGLGGLPTSSAQSYGLHIDPSGSGPIAAR